ncbi:nitrate reductase molybdenum cofactor assembly chaperone [Thalassotalea insulae]|uniref:Nitrate reductase molybdenum cofactor assembly chaperone n=1 Tax=Thalassotalea insulae TaxID=2056778 RepID=A0ABQ6GN32_9GAMM|nr:nitrate reductase molybdenum cofactor assembly chaperone [Thalassotalea insulae]GLX77408.1 nitrate reductase molybdenum cofactor assembly chaperone [Thalassotalea insulae]
MDILALISRLIDYPTEELVNAKADVVGFIESDEHLTADDKAGLLNFVEQRFSMDLLDWQSDYDAMFERGRTLSLLLFEHIHGESRDRGQAMIDLIAQYKAAGLDIGLRELPDYIPLFLEFVSTQGAANARGWLQDVAHILALLKVRLEKRDSEYAALFSALVNLAQADIDYADLAEQVKGEKRDDTKEAIDKVWEEEMVKFGPDANSDACGTAVNKPSPAQRRDQDVPIQFIDAIVADTVAKENVSAVTVSGGN